MPTINDVQVIEPVMTNMLAAFRQGADRFIAARVFPAVPVDTDSGTFYKFTKKYWFMDGLQPRAPGDPFARVDFGIESDTYKTLQWAADYALADEVRANVNAPLDLERAAVQYLGNLSMLRKEIQWATDFMKTGVWGTDNSSATDWDDYSSGDPIANILTAQETISSATGYMPNTLIVGAPVHSALMNHPDVLDRIKYTQTATAGNMRSALLSVLGIDNYYVASAIYNTAAESAAMSAANVIDDDALLLYVDAAAGGMGLSAGKTFVWGPGGGEGTLYRYRDYSRHADVIQIKEQWDQKVVAAELGYFWSDIV